MRIYLGSDHAGLELKDHLVKHLAGGGLEVVDVGPLLYDAEDDYPPFCLHTAAKVVADAGSLGIVVGGSGNGEQIAANKVPGCRASLAWSVETAKLGRQHNDANVVAIGGRMHSLEEATSFADAFVDEAFSGAERHQRRIDMLTAWESTHELPELP